MGWRKISGATNIFIDLANRHASLWHSVCETICPCVCRRVSLTFACVYAFCLSGVVLLSFYDYALDPYHEALTTVRIARMCGVTAQSMGAVSPSVELRLTCNKRLYTAEKGGKARGVLHVNIPQLGSRIDRHTTCCPIRLR